MGSLSKSKLIAFRQCPKRLWLEIHRPELRDDSTATEASFAIGNEVGAVAKKIFDPEGNALEINPQRDGFAAALAQSKQELQAAVRPLFEAAMAAGGGFAMADIMLPYPQGGWQMIEVKSSASVKDYHRDDAAIQSFVARAAGVDLTSVGVAHIDSSWTYPGDGDYRGLLRVEDLTAESVQREAEVRTWVADAQNVAALPEAPDIQPGPQCLSPFECGFCTHCHRDVEQPEMPLALLPRLSAGLKKDLFDQGIEDIRQVPDSLLNGLQLRVKTHTVANTVYFDANGAASDLAGLGLPARFLDFETVNLAVPRWAHTRPYQQIPFQFSLHTVEDGRLSHTSFLDLSGTDPSESFARALIHGCGDRGPIFVYNAAFECRILADLAVRFPPLAPALQSIVGRVVDLLPIARARFYHPSQRGSWSIKQVLPAAIPGLAYDELDGVNDGNAAMQAFAEAIHATTTPTRRAEIKRQLEDYCRLDTYAMVRLWQFFRGDTPPLVDER